MPYLSVDSVRRWISCGITFGLLSGGVLLASDGQFVAGNWSEPQFSTAGQQSSLPSEQSSDLSEKRSSVSLAPAVVVVHCKFSQSYTQVLTLTNQTTQDFVSEMVAQDVVVRDGKRSFVAAGETPGSIAATAVFSQKEVVVRSGESVSVGVTFTVPPDTSLRAVVALFRGLNKIPSGGPVVMTASLGALFTFSVSENFQVAASPVVVGAQSTTKNLAFSQVLTNTGSEPFVTGGKAVLLSDAGTLMGKASFEEQRLLPGERLLFSTEYPTELKSGNYRVFASFQYEEKVITNSADFTVP